MGSATVPVAAIGVPPMDQVHLNARPTGSAYRSELVGETPTSARETRALPEANRTVPAEPPVQGIQRSAASFTRGWLATKSQ